jgi:hypothetical protein
VPCIGDLLTKWCITWLRVWVSLHYVWVDYHALIIARMSTARRAGLGSSRGRPPVGREMRQKEGEGPFSPTATS